MQRPTQAVILAGGRGTRLRPLTDHRPKAMIEFHGKPFLGYLVEMLRDQGFRRLLLLLGYLPNVIIDHFGDGSGYGVEIEYDVTEPDDLTGFRVRHARDRLDDVFLMLYCDNYWPMRFDAMWRAFLDSGAQGQVTVYTNEDSYTRDGVKIGEDGFVEVFDRSRTQPGLNGVEIGFAVLQRDVVLPLLPERQRLFEDAVYPPLIARHALHAFRTGHRYYSVGGHERLWLTDAFFAREPAVILDRDGVLNERPPRAEYVTTPEQFRWLPGARQAVTELAAAGWRIIVVSNQAGIGRGAMTVAALEAVHDRMRSDASATGGRIDAIYVCPHDWDAGCSCRKPRPGMLLQAQRDFHLDLTRTVFIGDDERDAMAADAAGCQSALVSERQPLLDLTRRLIAGTSETIVQ
ncbi:MAG: HAD-IIIA family hydrolase [Longimicrobiales bacterium]